MAGAIGTLVLWSYRSLGKLSRDITATAPHIKAPHSRADAYLV